MSTSSYGPSTPSADHESDQDRNASRVDGGHRAWLVVLGGFLDFATAFGNEQKNFSSIKDYLC
jgi:hypothetical protein